MKRTNVVVAMTHENCSTCCNRKNNRSENQKPQTPYFWLIYVSNIPRNAPLKTHKFGLKINTNENEKKRLDIYAATKNEA